MLCSQDRRGIAGDGGNATFSDHVFQLCDGGLLEVDMVEDERALRAELEGLDDSDSKGCVRRGASKVRRGVVDAVVGHFSR